MLRQTLARVWSRGNRISVLIKWTWQPQSGKFREGSGNLPLWGVAAGTCKLIVLETG
jgi:hypothetical protein